MEVTVGDLAGSPLDSRERARGRRLPAGLTLCHRHHPAAPCGRALPRERGQAMLRKHFRLASSLTRLAPALAVGVPPGSQSAPTSPPQNHLTNPGFDTNLDVWKAISTASWDGTLDAGGSPRSGSAKGIFDASMATGIDGVVAQCGPLTIR